MNTEAHHKNGAFEAAQYVRMSTEHQQYSTQNQADKIQEYADKRGIEIIKTYADEGKSGLSIGGRAALQRLISDVETGIAEFNVILVYDVSRWGRFQDADESTYYEYICRRAGIQVAYPVQWGEFYQHVIDDHTDDEGCAYRAQHNRYLTGPLADQDCADYHSWQQVNQINRVGQLNQPLHRSNASLDKGVGDTNKQHAPAQCADSSKGRPKKCISHVRTRRPTVSKHPIHVSASGCKTDRSDSSNHQNCGP